MQSRKAHPNRHIDALIDGTESARLSEAEHRRLSGIAATHLKRRSVGGPIRQDWRHRRAPVAFVRHQRALHADRNRVGRGPGTDRDI